MRETTSPGIATRGFPKQFTDHLKTSLGVVSAGVTKAATVHAKQAIAPSSTEDAVNASTEALQKQTETLQTLHGARGGGPVQYRPRPIPPLGPARRRPSLVTPLAPLFATPGFSDFSRIFLGF